MVPEYEGYGRVYLLNHNCCLLVRAVDAAVTYVCDLKFTACCSEMMGTRPTPNLDVNNVWCEIVFEYSRK